MKANLKSLLPLLPVWLLTGTVSAELDPQPRMAFHTGVDHTFAADWEGVVGRTYFMQWSSNLTDWRYAPFIHFGDGMHTRGLVSSTQKFFIRLHYGDFPGITSLDEAMEADFDSDGLSNIFEVTFGYDPFDPVCTADGADNVLDPEGDGMTNATENTKGLNPMAKDNPKLLLQVYVE